MSGKVEQDAGKVRGEQGDVMVDGPSGAVFSLTPSAARDLGRKLVDVADTAEGETGDGASLNR